MEHVQWRISAHRLSVPCNGKNSKYITEKSTLDWVSKVQHHKGEAEHSGVPFSTSFWDDSHSCGIPSADGYSMNPIMKKEPSLATDYKQPTCSLQTHQYLDKQMLVNCSRLEKLRKKKKLTSILGVYTERQGEKGCWKGQNWHKWNMTTWTMNWQKGNIKFPKPAKRSVLKKKKTNCFVELQKDKRVQHIQPKLK